MATTQTHSQTEISTRKAYGQALIEIGKLYPEVVVLDAETSNSTYAEDFKKAYPERFVEAFIAEQNMVSVATGLSRMGKIPFVSTFAAFFTRAFDQIRMSQYARSNIKFVGSHAGVSIGEDGASQMALEDLAMFRSLHDFTVLYPSDGVSMKALVHLVASTHGNAYIRTTRANTPFLYDENEEFLIGGSKTLFQSDNDVVTVCGAGITLHEAVKAYHELKTQGITIRVIDLYSVKPLDVVTISNALQDTKALLIVEDHHPEGGIYEAVCGAVAANNTKTPIYSLAVNKEPHSGKPNELMQYEEIGSEAIVNMVQKLV